MAASTPTLAMTLPTDAELIQQTLSGDESGFAAIVERYQRKIFRVAFAITRDEMEADIVTQDSFVQAYTHLDRFEGRSGLETWLTRITINRAKDSLRKRKWQPLSFSRNDEEGEHFDPADDRPDAERLVASTQISRAIDKAVHSLSSQQKVIFRLRHFENMALEEIATLLDLQPGTVRAHLFRAVHKVRAALAHWIPGESMTGGTS